MKIGLLLLAGSLAWVGYGGSTAPAPSGASDAAVDNKPDAAVDNRSDAGVSAPPDAAPVDTGPAPSSTWVNVTADLIAKAPDGKEVSIVAAVPGSNRVLAGLGARGYWATDDSGKTWSQLDPAAGIDDRPTAVVFDPAHASTFWLPGIYGSVGGVFRTTDSGQTLTHLGNSFHNDLVSVDFTDPDRKTLLLGPHEMAHKLYLSKDGGDTWNDIGGNLPADSNFSTFPLVLDPQSFLVGSCGYGPGACGIFRSADGGATWTSATSEAPQGVPLRASDGTIYWPLDGPGIVVSTDSGKTWVKGGAGPVPLTSGGPLELPDGRIVSLGSTNLVISSDKGKTWTPIGEPMPFPGANCGIYGFTYSTGTKTFFLNHNDCSGNLLPNAVWTAGFGG